MERDLYLSLYEWKESKNRKPLVLNGARQVGKTSLVRTFAKDFECFVELNLEREKNKNLFAWLVKVSPSIVVVYPLNRLRPWMK